MTNSNDALRACPFCAAILEYCNDKDGEFWMHPGLVTDGGCFMSGTGIFPRQVAAWNRRPSPVAGGDLREAAQALVDFIGPKDMRVYATDLAVRDLVAALNQPAAPVEADKLIMAAINQNDAMRQELSHVGNLISDLARRMRIEVANDDGSWPDLSGRIKKLIDNAHPPEPAASTLAQGEGCHLPPRGWICTRGHGHDGPCAAYRPSRWDGVPELIEAITEDEGAAVTFTGQNPDFNGLPNECVVVCGPNTDWKDVHFRADTLADCLHAATHHKGSSDGQ